MMDPIPLDADLVNIFKDKTMAVVGYETNQATIIEIPTPFRIKTSSDSSGYENK